MININKLNIENFSSFDGTNFDIELTYELFGQPIGESPIVLINHALTGNSSVSGSKGWWNSIVGDKKLIDTN